MPEADKNQAVALQWDKNKSKCLAQCDMAHWMAQYASSLEDVGEGVLEEMTSLMRPEGRVGVGQVRTK